MATAPEPVAPEIFTLNPNHPDVALATISRYILRSFDDLRDNTVSVDDLAMGMAALAQLASTFFAALDSSVADRQQLNDRVTLLERKRMTLSVAAPVSLGLLSIGTRDITLTWDRALPANDYEVDLWPSPGLLGPATFTVKARNATTVVVTVTNTALLGAGGSLAAIAWRYS